jgi:Papain-like cysteine protease AvrRpt2
MSLRKTQDEILRLDFDPSITAVQEKDKSRFEWAIDHENQLDGDWCWAACLSNALTCVGFFVRQDEIVDRFYADHGESADAIDDQRIPTPQDVVDLWRSYGFYGANWENEALPFEDLAKEIAANGPVQIEFWKEGDEKERHLALVSGVRETEGGPQVCLSDPAAMALDWLSFDRMRGLDPLGSDYGEWRRTYVGLGYQKGYLRRFFGRPSRYLAELELNEEPEPEGAEPKSDPVQSKLEFEMLPPSPFHLSQELALSSHGYRDFRYRTAPQEKKQKRLADLGKSLFLLESIPVWKSPSEIDFGSSLKEQLRFHLWHHQIYDSEGPRYYAHSWYFEKLRQRFDRAWRTTWFGEKWMARRVNEAISYLESAPDLANRAEKVRMVLLRRYGLVTVLLLESNLHIVVSAHEKRSKIFPLLSRFTEERLRAALAAL